MSSTSSTHTKVSSLEPPMEHPWRPYSNQLPFRRAELDKIPEDAFGLYGLWFRKRCLYIGQAQSIARRLEQHWRRTHNDDLGAWIRAKGTQLRISYLILDQHSESDIDSLEAAYIRRFQPVTNKQLK